MSWEIKPCSSNLEVKFDNFIELSDETICASSTAHRRNGNGENPPLEIPTCQPIVNSATYCMRDADAFMEATLNSGHVYIRCNNETVEALECTVRLLERGAGSLAFASGMAAISNVMFHFLQPGDHVILNKMMYSGTIDLALRVFPKMKIETTFVEHDIEEYKKHIKSNTKMLYVESPSNPFGHSLDLEELAKVGIKNNILTVIDATCSSPYLCKPITLGIDVVIQSATKYMSGHSDLCAGVVTLKSIENWRALVITRMKFGAILSPYEASLLIRGLRTLPIRMERHCDNAEKVVKFLEGHPSVSRVFYAGLATSPGYEAAKKQMKRFGALLSFEVKNGSESAKKFVNSVKLVVISVSFGSTKTFVCHPESSTHSAILCTEEDRKNQGITPGQIRMSVGIENVDDIIADLDQALKKSQLPNSK